MENVNFILKFIPSCYIKNLLEIVVNLKIKKWWPVVNITMLGTNNATILVYGMRTWHVQHISSLCAILHIRGSSKVINLKYDLSSRLSSCSLSSFLSPGHSWRLRCMPYFYVIGIQKGGTTALSELIDHYLPGYVSGIGKEYHFWEHRRVYGWWNPKDTKCGKKTISILQKPRCK